MKMTVKGKESQRETNLTRHGLKQAVARVCLSMGWTSIHSQPLDILADVLHRYISEIGRSTQARAELHGRSESNVVDLSQVLHDFGVSGPDLQEYVSNFEVGPAKEVPPYPSPANDDLNILKAGSREVLHRPQHVHSHLPAMYPELEEEQERGEEEGKEEEVVGHPTTSSTPDKRKAGDKREVPKQADDGCPLREISSVMMTSSGFLSPCREGKMPDSKRPHVDPEEKKAVSRRHGDKGKGGEKGKAAAERKDIYNRDAMIKMEMMAASEVKAEPVDYQSEDENDFEEMIDQQAVKTPGRKKDESSVLDTVMESVIQKGIRDSERLPKVEPTSDSDGWEAPDDAAPAAKAKKEPEKKKPAAKKANKKNQGHQGPPPAMSDLFSAPQHFTAGGASPKAKMARIPKNKDPPKITEKVSLPTPANLGLGGLGGLAGMRGLVPGQNPLIPGGSNPLIPGGSNPLMGFYGFGGMPGAGAGLIPGAGAGLIPGLSPNLLGQMAMMQQVQAQASASVTSGDADIGEEDEDDDEEEGEVISPPRTPTAVPSLPIKKEEEDVVVVKENKEREQEKEKERKEKEAEENRKKMALLAAERDRLKEEEARAKEKEKEKEEARAKEAKEKEKIKERQETEKERLKQEKRDFEKEKKKAKKEKKDKDKEKDKAEKEKSKKEKKKEKKEKKKEKKEKEKEKKPDEPTLFAPLPLLKIKPMGPSSTSTSSTPSKAEAKEAPATPKLVIKPLAKEKEVEAVPMLGFQPLRTGPARTPKAAPPAASPATPKVGEKRKAGRPPNTPTTASQVKEKKARESRKVKSKELVEEASVESDQDTTPGIITETVGSYTDEAGNKVWICPACGKQDDGSPMIGCDECDDWYHWLCVGINSEPSENQDWFCTRCMAKKQGLYLDSTATFHPKQRRK